MARFERAIEHGHLCAALYISQSYGEPTAVLHLSKTHDNNNLFSSLSAYARLSTRWRLETKPTDASHHYVNTSSFQKLGQQASSSFLLAARDRVPLPKDLQG